MQHLVKWATLESLSPQSDLQHMRWYAATWHMPNGTGLFVGAGLGRCVVYVHDGMRRLRGKWGLYKHWAMVDVHIIDCIVKDKHALGQISAPSSVQNENHTHPFILPGAQREYQANTLATCPSSPGADL